MIVQWLKDIRWDVLILFGGGLALANAMTEHGVASWIGAWLTKIDHLDVMLITIVIATSVVLIGELASNTATAAIFLPIVSGISNHLHIDPIQLILPVALAATIGFMLPVATPPNAILYGSGQIATKDMIRAGAVLDILGIIIVLAAGWTIGQSVLR